MTCRESHTRQYCLRELLEIKDEVHEYSALALEHRQLIELPKNRTKAVKQWQSP